VIAPNVGGAPDSRLLQAARAAAKQVARPPAVATPLATEVGVMSRRALRVLLLSFAVLAVFEPVAAHAQFPTEFIDGGTCIPYPNTPQYGVAYNHWLWSFNFMAFCHITMTETKTANRLIEVLFNVPIATGPITGRLCLHDGGTTISCGPPGTFWAGLPATSLPSPSGAYVQFTNTSGNTAMITQLEPIWF
jgi:hypothetical protein